MEFPPVYSGRNASERGESGRGGLWQLHLHRQESQGKRHRRHHADRFVVIGGWGEGGRRVRVCVWVGGVGE